MDKRNLQIGYHLVAFLDVLGQRERFKGLHLPTTPEEEVEVAEVLRQTAGFVIELREIYGSHYKTFESALINLRKHTSEPVLPKFAGFSDSFVTSVPLHTDGSHLIPIISVFSALSAAATAMVTSLACKHPLRGGIEVGLATEITATEIYGSALEKAYLLESRDAGYPRILIGDELWNYLTVIVANFEAQTSSESRAITGIAQRSMKLITIDNDGKRILDYLGPVMSELNAPNASETMIRPLYKFVLAEQERISRDNDDKLIARYRDLRQYVESRLHMWEIEVAEV